MRERGWVAPISDTLEMVVWGEMTEDEEKVMQAHAERLRSEPGSPWPKLSRHLRVDVRPLGWGDRKDLEQQLSNGYTIPPEEPRASRVTVYESHLCVWLKDGRMLHVPLAWFPKLAGARQEDQEFWQLIGDGEGIRWSRIDEDLSVAAMLCPHAKGMLLPR